MSQRIEKRFAEVKAQSRSALVTFIMGGDPDMAGSQKILEALPAAGADIIEIGMPFSDPMADGPTIQAAGKRALEAGASVRKILAMVKQFRSKDSTTPLVLMGYFNPVYCYGSETFCRDAAAAGADGLIIVDLPPEEENELKPFADKNGLSLIRLIAPTSGDERVEKLCRSASGFVYYISITGITGAASAKASDLQAQVQRLRQFTPLPVAVGFGIKTPAQVAELAPFADAVVVGSALVEVIEKSKADAKAVSAFVSSLAAALKAPGKRAAG